MILSRQHLVLILTISVSVLSLRVPEAFALCMEEPGNLLQYCRGSGFPGFHLPDWYNQPLGILYSMVGLVIFIGMLLGMIFFIKHNKLQQNQG